MALYAHRLERSFERDLRDRFDLDRDRLERFDLEPDLDLFDLDLDRDLLERRRRSLLRDL